MSKEAADHNSAIIAQHNYNLPNILLSISNRTQLKYGSELRPASELALILQNHELWDGTHSLLQQESSILLQPSDPAEDKTDVKLGLERDNHKGAVNQPDLLYKLVSKDATHGFALPITQETVAKIKDGLWAPLKIAEQWSINDTGERIEKKCLTESNLSINDKIDEEKIEPLIYGYIFLRLIHMIHMMRMCHSYMVIFICK